MDASPVCPGNNPTITENIVVSVERGGGRLDAVDFLKLRRVVYGWEAGNKGI